MNEDVPLLCTGKKEMEREIMMLEDQFPDAARGIAEFSTPLAHQIIAGQHNFAANLPDVSQDTEICLPNWKQDKARQSTPKQS
jgi:hypothetical protein